MSTSNLIAHLYDVLLSYRRAGETPVQTVQRLIAERDKAASLLIDAQMIIDDYHRSHQLEYGCEVDPCDNCQLAAGLVFPWKQRRANNKRRASGPKPRSRA